MALHSRFQPLVDTFRQKDYQLLYHYSRYVQFSQSSIIVSQQEYISKGLVILVLRGSLQLFSGGKQEVIDAGQILGT